VSVTPILMYITSIRMLIDRGGNVWGQNTMRNWDFGSEANFLTER